MKVHHVIHFENSLRIEAGPELAAVLHAITQKLNHIMSALDNLKTQVTALETVEASAVTLLQGLKAALDAAIASGDPAAIQAVADQLGTDTATLAAAVAANTPAATP